MTTKYVVGNLIKFPQPITWENMYKGDEYIITQVEKSWIQLDRTYKVSKARITKRFGKDAVQIIDRTSMLPTLKSTKVIPKCLMDMQKQLRKLRKYDMSKIGCIDRHFAIVSEIHCFPSNRSGLLIDLKMASGLNWDAIPISNRVMNMNDNVLTHYVTWCMKTILSERLIRSKVKGKAITEFEPAYEWF